MNRKKKVPEDEIVTPVRKSNYAFARAIRSCVRKTPQAIHRCSLIDEATKGK
ncbi:MAG TPA: hypothetical protein VMT62_08800 [Syntrophorhabdaceae bacterium]|nr:hypothetical protein [Syntrophorhabdaceae bacterium]